MGPNPLKLCEELLGCADADRIRAVARYGARVVAAGMLVCTLAFVLLLWSMLWAFKRTSPCTVMVPPLSKCPGTKVTAIGW